MVLSTMAARCSPFFLIFINVRTYAITLAFPLNPLSRNSSFIGLFIHIGTPYRKPGKKISSQTFKWLAFVEGNFHFRYPSRIQSIFTILIQSVRKNPTHIFTAYANWFDADVPFFFLKKILWNNFSAVCAKNFAPTFPSMDRFFIRIKRNVFCTDQLELVISKRFAHAVKQLIIKEFQRKHRHSCRTSKMCKFKVFAMP